jgi:DHA2 family multidrug resistance protein
MNAASSGAAAEAAPHRGFITFSVMLASVMQTLDNTIANVALPHIQGALSSTQDQMSWVLTSYIVAAAITMPLTGWLAGRLGRRRILLYSIVGFTIASALCGFAQTLPQMIAARLLQGVSGAALVPMSQAVLLDINPPERHARAMSVWAMGATIGPIFGPALGGWLTEHYSWRWVFFINVPIGIVCWFGVVAFMRETQRRLSRFDFFGFASLSVAIGSLQLLFDRGQANDWFNHIETWIEAGISATATYLFVAHLLTTRTAPFFSPAIFRDRNFVTGNLFIFVVGVVLFATLALLPPLLQGLMGYPIVLSGLVTAPRGIGTIAAMLIAGRVSNIVDPRYVIAAGFLLTALSLWFMTGMSLEMDFDLVLWSGMLQGFGTGFVFVPLSAIAFTTLHPSLRNEGTAVFSLMRNMGSSIGISVVTTMLTRNTQIMHARLAERVTPYTDSVSGMSAQAIDSVAGLAAVNAEVTRQAAMIAYNNDFKMMLVLTLCVVPLVVLLRPVRPGTKIEPAVME